VIDCGVHCFGGLEAGRALAEICMANLGNVRFSSCRSELFNGVSVQVSTDQPVAACMASQYAGWKIAVGDFFAMGSGPMRAVAAKESLFETIGFREDADAVIGVLESASLPSDEVCRAIAEDCRVSPERLTLLVAPTSSQAGTVQIVARSVETALHKMQELGFDISRIQSGFGTAPLPPVAADDLDGIGRTNDAVLYGGEVILWVTGDDSSLDDLGPQIPSSASPDHGRPFIEIFELYDKDFYKIDPMLFSPAAVSLINLDSGNTHRFGTTEPDIIRRSFLN
jgi:methenyltetrahydromethanopterin cyclohydrolase